MSCTVQDAGLCALTAVAKALSSPLQPSPKGRGQLQILLDMVMKGVWVWVCVCACMCVCVCVCMGGRVKHPPEVVAVVSCLKYSEQSALKTNLSSLLFLYRLSAPPL